MDVSDRKTGIVGNHHVDGAPANFIVAGASAAFWRARVHLARPLAERTPQPAATVRTAPTAHYHAWLIARSEP